MWENRINKVFIRLLDIGCLLVFMFNITGITEWAIKLTPIFVDFSTLATGTYATIKTISFVYDKVKIWRAIRSNEHFVKNGNIISQTKAVLFGKNLEVLTKKEMENVTANGKYEFGKKDKK